MIERENIITNIPNVPMLIKESLFLPSSRHKSIHFHKEIEIIKVKQGSVLLTVDNDEFVMSRGEIAVVNCNVVHKISYHNSNSVITYFQFDVYEYMKEIYPDINISLFDFITVDYPSKYAVFDASSLIYDCFDKIENEHDKKTFSYTSVISAYIRIAVAFLQREQIVGNVDLLSSNKNLSKLLPLLQYIDDNYQDQLTLDKLAEIMFLSKNHICKLFSIGLNSTFTKYLNYQRLNHSERLLLNTNLNMIDIALDSGFMSIQYFNRCFKKKHGITPFEYRRLNKKIMQ